MPQGRAGILIRRAGGVGGQQPPPSPPARVVQRAGGVHYRTRQRRDQACFTACHSCKPRLWHGVIGNLADTRIN